MRPPIPRGLVQSLRSLSGIKITNNVQTITHPCHVVSGILIWKCSWFQPLSLRCLFNSPNFNSPNSNYRVRVRDRVRRIEIRRIEKEPSLLLPDGSKCNDSFSEEMFRVSNPGFAEPENPGFGYRTFLILGYFYKAIYVSVRSFKRIPLISLWQAEGDQLHENQHA